MPLALASRANCCFQPSKPAAELPHCAASAYEPTPTSMASPRKTAVENPLLWVIRKIPWLAALRYRARLLLARIIQSCHGDNTAVKRNTPQPPRAERKERPQNKEIERDRLSRSQDKMQDQAQNETGRAWLKTPLALLLGINLATGLAASRFAGDPAGQSAPAARSSVRFSRGALIRFTSV